MNEFRFALGDMVMSKAAIADAFSNIHTGHPSLPSRMMVVERILQECPGGAQRHYGCSNGGDPLRFLEIQIVPAADFDPERYFAEEAQARKARRENP